MGGSQSSEATPQAALQVEPQVEAKKEEVKPVQEPAKGAAPAETKKPEAKAEAKASPKSVPKASPKDAPKAAAKPAAKDKAASPKKKVQGPPQQPGPVTDDSKKKGDKGATKGAGEKGAAKGAGKKGKAEAQGVQLCVRNLAKDCTPEQLRDLFAAFGELTSVDVKKNEDGTCRGFGFVSYSTMEAATKAIAEMSGKAMAGKSLVVVLSDRQQGTSKMEREGKGDGKSKGEGGKGKGKDGKADAGKGKGKGKAPAPINTNAPPAPAGWPSPYSGQNMEQLYAAYGYGYPMMSPMAAYASQGNYPQSPSNVQALQAQLMQAQAQAMQAQAQAFYSGLSGSSVVPGAAAISAAGISAQPPPPPTAPASNKPKPVQPVAGGTEYEGSLKSISAKNGYGFLTCAETKAAYGRDVFVDASLVPEGIQVGDKVVFSCALSEKGHPRATMVKLQKVVAR